MDTCFRVAYFVAYHIARVWWILRRPSIVGANVAIWRGDKLLLLRSSYRKGWQFPGGFKHKDEDPKEAATREANEEIGLSLRSTELSDPFIVKSYFESRKELNYIFEIKGNDELDIQIDNREIVAAAYFSVQEMAGMTITPTVRCYLETKFAPATSIATP